MPKHILYLGLNPTNFISDNLLTHAPVIQIVPYALTQVKSVLKQFSQFTHILFTSKTSVQILFPYLAQLGFTHADWNTKVIAAVGQATAQELQLYHLTAAYIAKEETAEGLIAEIDQLNFKKSHVFWPHSKLSRPLLKEYFTHKNVLISECLLYDTHLKQPNPLPDLELFDEIVFTSPSTVDGFLKCYASFPSNKKFTCVGPVTERYLKSKLAKLD